MSYVFIILASILVFFPTFQKLEKEVIWDRALIISFSDGCIDDDDFHGVPYSSRRTQEDKTMTSQWAEYCKIHHALY